jgi:hypothetical protein
MRPFSTMLCCLVLVTVTSQIYAQKTGASTDSLIHQIELLQMQAKELNDNPAGSPKAIEDLQEQIQELNAKVNLISGAQKQTRPNEFNPSIGLVGEVVTSYRTKGMIETGSDRPGGIDFNARSVELNVAASIDPFAKGYAVVNAAVDPVTGEATMGIEEAALQTTSLPWNLELKAGRFFGEFGRLGYIHDHELPFVNRPLVLDEYIGGESRTDGLQVNWLLPLSHYISLTAGAGDQFGGDAPPNNPGDFRHFDALNYWGRLSTYFDLPSDWQAEMGMSGLLNPKTEDRNGVLLQPDGSTLTEKKRVLVGADFSLKWVPLRNNQFQSLTWGSEALLSRNRYRDSITDANPMDTSIAALGLYSYVTWKFSRVGSAGFLFCWTENNQNSRDRTIQYAPYITWALSHWNQLRLQYTHTESNHVLGLANDDAVQLQWAWIIGSHSHGWQQR